MDEALVAVEASLIHRAQGLAVNRPRERVAGGPDVHVNTMQAADYELGVFGLKTYTLASGVYRFFVYLYGTESGELLAIIEANRIGQLRTGAATGIATDLMARRDAAEVGVIGSGFQARTQLEAVSRVRDLRRARVYSPNPAHRETFAHEMSRSLGLEVTPVGSPGQAVEGADILVTVTSSREPVFDGDWLEPGTHVSAVGGADPYVRELDDRSIQRADLIVVDDLPQARIEAGELMMPASRGLVLWEEMLELWQLVGGEARGRRHAEEITLFKSLGMALWDIAAAKTVYDKAVAAGIGKPLGD
jgi:ornithine cyclodeaminase/alanine dehydrogenase-like protein (mu-crystallin family)